MIYKKEKPPSLRYLIHGKRAIRPTISFRSHQLSVENVDHVATFQPSKLSLPISALPPRRKHSSALCTQPCTVKYWTPGIKYACLIMDQRCVGMACMIYKRPVLCVTSQWLGILGHSVAVWGCRLRFRRNGLSVENVDHVATFQLQYRRCPSRRKHSPGLTA
ncbi:hypothetical protein CEXT_494811 [Caerostris extrusa]|uniref:Uncharacterized protein n=1 Tax=Caerostris extrusa TaxID=172846 RepID=A0AAV4NZV1_CAEEX|nr:hypothetical protein CEXT_494811 [Caerostris extrusa]